MRQRRAAWVAFGVVALALVSGVAAESTTTSSVSTTTDVMAQVRVHYSSKSFLSVHILLARHRPKWLRQNL